MPSQPLGASPPSASDPLPPTRRSPVASPADRFGPVTSATSERSTYAVALDDLRSAWAVRGSWWLLARQSVQGSYRRTFLGPFWMTAQQLMWVLGIGVVYSQLFHVERGTFIPLLAYGVLIWQQIMGALTSAPSLFIDSASYLSSSNLPLSFYGYQALANQVITFAHTAVVMVIIPIMYGVGPTLWAIALVPLALGLVLLNSAACMLWLAPLGTRFRDVRVAIASVTQLLMFVTPVFWDPAQLPGRHWVVMVNPFAWPVLSFRDPLIGTSPDGLVWLLFAIATVVNCSVGFIVFSRARRRIRYWL